MSIDRQAATRPERPVLSDLIVREVRNEAAAGEATGQTRGEIRERSTRILVLCAVLLISAVYVGLHIGNGWVPADEGTLSQSALRTLDRQLPHRDFVEIYTGGLSFIHALAFRVFGTTLMSLRICVFLFFLAWLPAVYYIALRFTPASAAGLITLLAVSWSFPNYPAAMPSWYNLFFATFGAAALLRYFEQHKARWLFVAGLCGGISILIKVIGAYYIAGVLLTLVFVEQDRVDETREPSGERPSKALAFRLFKATALLLFLGVVVFVMRSRLGAGELYQFIFPAVALVVLLLLSDFKIRSGSVSRCRSLLRLISPFAAGVLLPILIFLIPYALSGSLGTFFAGVSGSAVARAAGLGVIRPLSPERALYALALLGLLACAIYLRQFQSRLVGISLGLGLLLLLSQSTQTVISGVWFSVATLTPLVVLSGVVLLWRTTHTSQLTLLQRQRIMLLISLAALCGLVQYPFAAPIYLSYCVPLTLLAAVAIVTTARKRPGTYVLASVMAFYLLFGVIRLVPDYIYELTHKVGPLQPLRTARAGGLRIESAPGIDALIQFLQQRASNGLLYAGNDCPELYFLAGLQNVTRDDAGAGQAEVLKALESTDLKVVVINEAPFFPGSEINPEVRAEVVRRFSHSQQIGIFHVFWRE